MKRIVRSLSAVLVIIPLLSLRAQTLNGVYAGLELRMPLIMGNGMERYDEVIYFRPDGTFTDQLEKPTWKTDVTGRYRISGKKVSLMYKSGSKDDMTLNADGDLDAGSYSLLHLKGINSVPPGFYEFTFASSSGGGSSAMISVGTSSQTGLNFDGKGNFTRNRSSATVVSGSGVGGGSSRNDSGAGTYTLKEGVLTLRFNDGTSQTHSFFCRPGYEPVMAAVDGNIYFMDKDKKEDSRSATTSRSATAPADKPAASSATEALDLLKKANLAHGGKALDALKTAKVSGLVAGISATTLLDIPARKLRVELRTNDKLTAVEQLEGDGGWQWQNGRKTPLPPNRVSEMSRVFTTGILGLRSANLAALPPPRIASTKEGMTSVTYKSGGTTFVLILNADNQLVGEGNVEGQRQTTVLYSGLKPVAGVVLPFAENQTTGAQKLRIEYTDYQLNPVLGADVWTVPN